MGFDIISYLLSRKYTEDSLAGVGALAGVPCQIQSKTAITGGTRITFLWEDNNGDSHTTVMDVMNGIDGQDGQDGQDGKGIQSVAVNENNHLIITYTDGTTVDAGQIEIHSVVDSVNGKTGAVTLDAEDVGALPANTPIPSKTSDLTNDSAFITKAVNDLVNYYLKSETYSKTEVDDIVTAIKNSRFEVVLTLPTTDIKTNVIYLVPKDPTQTSNVKDEYINLDGTTAGWEKIGDTEIDLSGYVTTEALNTALADYVTSTNLTTILADYVTETDLETALAEKQDTLTFDNAPTQNSINPVKSGGVYSANQTIYEVMGQNGAKNLLLFNLEKIKEANTSGTWADNVYSIDDLTATFNSDGSISLSGTTSEWRAIKLVTPSFFEVLPANTYTLTGCPSGGSSLTYGLVAQFKDGTTTKALNDYGSGATDTYETNVSLTGGNVFISLYPNIDFTGFIFKPMLRLASDTDSTYQPYAKTNKELTDEVSSLNTAIANKLEKVIISDISQIPNNDIKDLEDGVYTIILSVITDPNLLNAPPISSGVQLLITTASSGFRYFNCFPYNKGLPIYFGGLDPNGVIIGWRPVVVTSNRNLLDNPWFTVNQRGFTSRSDAGYTVDRWKNNNPNTVSISDDGITITHASNTDWGELTQYLETNFVKQLDGKTLTLSCIINGTIYSGTGIYHYNTDEVAINVSLNDFSLQLRNIPANTNRFIVRVGGNVANATVTIKAIKLEIGSISTLAMDTAPNYATELLKCQRYFVRYKANAVSNLALGFAVTATDLRFNLPLPVVMRQKPSITISNNSHYVYTESTASAGVSPTNVTIPSDALNSNTIPIRFECSGMTIGKPYLIYSASVDGYIDLSADL